MCAARGGAIFFSYYKHHFHQEGGNVMQDNMSAEVQRFPDNLNSNELNSARAASRRTAPRLCEQAYNRPIYGLLYISVFQPFSRAASRRVPSQKLKFSQPFFSHRSVSHRTTNDVNKPYLYQCFNFFPVSHRVAPHRVQS